MTHDQPATKIDQDLFHRLVRAGRNLPISRRVQFDVRMTEVAGGAPIYTLLTMADGDRAEKWLLVTESVDRMDAFILGLLTGIERF